MGPPKMSLLLGAKSMPALMIKPRFILVTHTDDLGWYIMSNQQGKMFIQNLQQDCQKAKCYAKAVPILHHRQYSNWLDVSGKLSYSRMSLELPDPSKSTADREEWSELPIGATTVTRTKSGTSVIRRSSVPPSAWVGPTTNWLQPETVAKSKAATPWQFLVVESNHSWWWPFKSPRKWKEARTSSTCMAALMLINNQKSGRLGQGCDKDCTHKGSVSHH